MDPFTIVALVARATGICLTTTKALYDLHAKYSGAPVVIVSICSESTVISASLAQIQSLLLQRQDLANVWSSRTELASALDTALTGCMVLFSCLDNEVQAIVSGARKQPASIRWRSKVRMVWNEQKLRELLDALRGQQTAINLLIQLLQMNTLDEIKKMIYDVWTLWDVQPKALASVPVQFVNGQWIDDNNGQAVSLNAIILCGHSFVEQINGTHQPILRWWQSTTNLIEHLAKAFNLCELAAVVSHGKDLIFSLGVLFRTTDQVTTLPSTGYLVAKRLCSNVTSILLLAKDLDPGASVPRHTARIFTNIKHEIRVMLGVGLRSSTTSRERDWNLETRASLIHFYVSKLTDTENRDGEYQPSQWLKSRQLLQEYVLAASAAGLCRTCGQAVESACWEASHSSIGTWHEECLRCQACGGKAAFAFEGANTTITSIICKHCKRQEATGVGYRRPKEQFIHQLYVHLAELIRAKRLEGSLSEGVPELPRQDK